jgi:hypothetical protein
LQPRPRQVFVVEVDPDTDLPAMTVRLQHTLATGGEVHPQVEVCPHGEQPPNYQTEARAGGAVWYRRGGTTPPRLAKVYDGADANGAWFEAGHPTLDNEDDWVRVLNYLSAGTILLETTGKITDILEAHLGQVVPMSFRTDGHWIWNDATWYYLHRYRLAPEPELLAHIRARRYAFTPPDDASLDLAMAVLMTPPDEEPVYRAT